MVLYCWAEVSAVSINKILALNHIAVVFLQKKNKDLDVQYWKISQNIHLNLQGDAHAEWPLFQCYYTDSEHWTQVCIPA